MLLQQMRSIAIIVPLISCAVATGQLTIDKPIVLTGATTNDRRIEGLGTAHDITDLATLGDAQNGRLLFGATAGTGNAVQLTLQPPTSAYMNGLRVRWIGLVENTGAVTIDVDGLGARPLRDRAGLPLNIGALRAGQVVEVLYADSVFILTSGEPQGCPEGYLAANANFCIMQNEGPELNWFEAAAYCADQGAALCTWDQFLFSCRSLQGQMNDLFDNWEWIDDTSDHTHSADQINRWSCISMFNISASLTDLGRTRCCYPLR
ncbi:MAG: hypothetical protein IPJ76_14345 [Flavobacteriales bacterium]|nr:MAG: hypothetical protein IPJ76_14345 [Flavobacteriales bacterium]